MHIDGKPLLSRATVSSGRILITFALGIILAKAYAIESETIIIIVAEIKTAELSGPAMWVIVFMLIGYGINLWGDYTSFRTWNSGAGLMRRGDGAMSTPLYTQIADLTESLKILQMKERKIYNEHASNNELLEALKERGERFMQLKERAENLIKGAESLSKKAKIVLYGWHFAMPPGLAIVAFFMLLFDIG